MTENDAMRGGQSADAGVLAYYDQMALAYVERTWDTDMTAVRSRFLARLPAAAHVLDAGCGSGRDALAFSRAGLTVDAFDGSTQMVALARERTGLPVAVLRFDQLSAGGVYDGVWACASLVHLADDQLSVALARLHAGLKTGGMLFTCLKEGRGSRIDSEGRPFNDFTKDRLRRTMRESRFTLRDLWRTPQRGSDSGFWLNVIAAKL